MLFKRVSAILATLALLSLPAYATCSGQAPGSCVSQDDGQPKPTPTLGSSTIDGSLTMWRGAQSLLVQPSSTAGNVTVTLPATAGVLVNVATSPLVNTAGTLSLSTVPISLGGTGQATASTAFSALSPMTTAGDIIYGGTSGVGTRLAAGTSSQVLSGGTTPTWGAVTNALQATMPARTMKANTTGGSAVPSDVSATAWLDAAYCNTVGYYLVRWTGAWTCSQAIAANPVWWGADPTGASDSAAAFNSALAASNNIAFPAGKFKFLSNIGYTFGAGIASLSITGAGQGVTTLYWPSSGGGLTLNYYGKGSSANISGLSLTTGTTNGGYALVLVQTAAESNPGAGATTSIRDVTIRGDDGYRLTDYWGIGVDIVNVSNVNIDGLTVSGSSSQQGTGASIVGLVASSTYAVVLNIDKSNFVGLAYGFIYGSYVQGVTIDKTNFTFVSLAITSLSSETGALVQLDVTNSQFNPGSASGGAAIILQTFISGFVATNNFFVIGGPSQFGIYIAQVGHCQISNNSLQGLASTSSNAIVIGAQYSGSPCDVSHNDIYGFITSGTAIWLQASSAGVNVSDNMFASNGTNIVNSGTGNRITDNLGYNPVGAAAITTSSSPYTYTAGASPETIYIAATTITAVTQGGISILPAALGTTDFTIQLGPNEPVVITYTGTLVAKKMVH